MTLKISRNSSNNLISLPFLTTDQTARRPCDTSTEHASTTESCERTTTQASRKADNTVEAEVADKFVTSTEPISTLVEVVSVKKSKKVASKQLGKTPDLDGAEAEEGEVSAAIKESFSRVGIMLGLKRTRRKMVAVGSI